MSPRTSDRRVPLMAAVAVALLASACSTGGVMGSRSLSLSSNDPPPPRPATRSSLGQSAPTNDPQAAPAGNYTWNGSPDRIVQGAGAGVPAAGAPAGMAGPQPAPAAAAPPAPDVPRAPQAAAPPGSIVVGQGDTLYGLSRKHGVPISALIDVNRLSSAQLTPGQILKLPRQTRPRA